MAGVTGLEPATSGVTGRRSNQLSYTPFEGLSPYGNANNIIKWSISVKHIASFFIKFFETFQLTTQ
jgi:hypothetical protein